MITFRFYLVTLVAVFLAVALGVVIGSTFTEPALVENLQQRVDDVQNNLDDRVAAIDDLNAEIDGLTAYLDQSAPWAVDAQLTGTEVLVVADDGVDGDDVEALVERVRQAGGSTEGIVWIQPSFALEEDDALGRLTQAIGPVGADPTAAAATAWEMVLTSASGAAPTGPARTTTTAPGTTDPAPTPAPSTTVPPAPATAADVLEGPTVEALVDAGFLSVQTVDGPSADAGQPANPDLPLVIVLVTGQESNHPAPEAAVAARAEAQAGVGIPTVVAEVFAESDDGEESAERGDTLVGVIGDSDLAALGLVSTVDDLDLVQGRVAVVLAAGDLGRGVVGHYGYGDSAERVLPEWLATAP